MHESGTILALAAFLFAGCATSPNTSDAYAAPRQAPRKLVSASDIPRIADELTRLDAACWAFDILDDLESVTGRFRLDVGGVSDVTAMAEGDTMEKMLQDAIRQLERKTNQNPKRAENRVTSAELHRLSGQLEFLARRCWSLRFQKSSTYVVECRPETQGLTGYTVRGESSSLSASVSQAASQLRQLERAGKLKI